ncbi:MAG TPA: M81 family metallopeptidase [Burkholderiaceae bacterium]|nr:M81 family metallopeptidase [Burkholderiaceae bacterium]
MKIVAARLNHETNTFSPVPTPLESFGPDGPTFGAAAYQAARGTRTGLGAFIEAAEARGDRLTVAVSATANPSGRVDDAAYEQLTGAICAAVREGCDAIMLDLHGAMVAQSIDDGEGELLRRLRTIAPDTPLAVALDLHGNITQAMVKHADVIVGFKTYPHIDMFETGAHAARLLFEAIDHGRKPALAWARPPLLSHTLRSATGEGAMQRAVERARRMEEAEGLLAVTVFAGFSLADIADAGMSVVTVAHSRAEAQRAADELAAQLWDERASFVYASAPLTDSVAQARLQRARDPVPGRPVLLLDHGDNVMSGGTCDTTDLLEECLRQSLRGIGVGPVCDPRAVATAIDAGVGARLDIQVGNARPLGLGSDPRPRLQVQARVRAITDGRFRISGPIYTGETWSMGRTIVLEADAFTMVVCERPMEPLDLGVFESAGVDPRRFDFLILKSRMYCRPSFVPLSSALVECDSRGVTSSDYALFPFRRVRRPIYPFDKHATLQR